jgi:hypothetical protein
MTKLFFVSVAKNSASLIIAGAVLITGYEFVNSAEFKCSMYHHALLNDPQQAVQCMQAGVLPSGDSSIGVRLILKLNDQKQQDLLKYKSAEQQSAKTIQQEWNQEQDDKVQREQTYQKDTSGNPI